MGQGTWHMDMDDPDDALEALERAIDVGMTHFDTAEIYGDGNAERLVAKAIKGQRDKVFLASKVAPSHASRQGTLRACEGSLRRLGTDHLDLYLLHWPGNQPLEDTFAAFEELVDSGKIRHWGVSNFDAVDLAELITVAGGDEVATDQVLYNLSHRQAEVELFPWCREWGIPVMAYSPVDRGELVEHDLVVEVAERHGATAAQVALAWVLRHDDVCAIPKASIRVHVRENARALELRLDADDLKLLDDEFRPPSDPHHKLY
jgi:diketogulonate reductase-like aldo/keto reductase